MPVTEVPTLEAPATEPVSDQDAAASLDSGFASEAPTDPDKGTPEPPAASASESPKVDPVAADAPKAPAALATITEEAFQNLLTKATEIDQIKAALDQRFNGLGGKMGGIERTLKELQAATPSGKALAVSADDFEELKSEFPELAELTVKGLNRALGKMRGTGTAEASTSPDALHQLVATQVSALDEAREIKRLARKMPDWQHVVGGEQSNTPYRQWLAAQPSDYQQLINHSNDSDEIIDSIARFRKEATPKGKSPISDREKQLRAAVPLKSAAGNLSVSDDDSFAEGFRKELAASH